MRHGEEYCVTTQELIPYIVICQRLALGIEDERETIKKLMSACRMTQIQARKVCEAVRRRCLGLTQKQIAMEFAI